LQFDIFFKDRSEVPGCDLNFILFDDILAPLQIYVFEYLLLSLKYRKEYGRLEQINFNSNDLNIDLLFFLTHIYVQS
jgi:hypothetical protein